MEIDKKKVWKYFWQQKRKEIWEGIKVILMLTLCFVVLYAFLELFLNVLFPLFEKIPDYVNFIIFVIVVVFLLAFFIFMIGLSIIDWLKSNWKKAKRRVIKESKKKR